MIIYSLIWCCLCCRLRNRFWLKVTSQMAGINSSAWRISVWCASQTHTTLIFMWLLVRKCDGDSKSRFPAEGVICFIDGEPARLWDTFVVIFFLCYSHFSLYTHKGKCYYNLLCMTITLGQYKAGSRRHASFIFQ